MVGLFRHIKLVYKNHGNPKTVQISRKNVMKVLRQVKLVYRK